MKLLLKIAPTIKLQLEIALQNCYLKLLYKIASRNCILKMHKLKFATQNCTNYKIATQTCTVKLQYKIAT